MPARWGAVGTRGGMSLTGADSLEPPASL